MSTYNPEHLLPHPLASAFPNMSDEDFAALVEDIRTHGQRMPIVVLDGLVLDGRHRLRATLQVGIMPIIEQFTGDAAAAVAYVLSQNLHRRHLSASQRAAAVVACNEWVDHGTNRFTIAEKKGNVAHLAETPIQEHPPRAVTTAEMAKLAQVGERTIKDAKAAHKAGLTEAVKDGAMSVSEAAKIARGTPEKPKAAKPAAAPAPAPEPDAPAVTPAPNSKAAREEEFRRAAEEAHGEFDALTAFEEAQREILQLQAQIKAASADDAKASAMHWQRMAMVADQRRDDAMARAHRMEQELKQHAKWLRRVGLHFGEDVPVRVAGAVDGRLKRLGALVGEEGVGKVLSAVERALQRAGQPHPRDVQPPVPAAPAPVAPRPSSVTPTCDVSQTVRAIVPSLRDPHIFADNLEFI